MPYYAHIRQDENGETVYQTVAEHLTGTAALCREFAADFGAEADGDLMGLAHDLGKCTDAFQKRLLEGGPVVDHTTAGMLTCIKMKRPSAAACAAGHHGGLLDVGNLRTDRAGEATLSGRFKKGAEGHYLERCGESGVTLPTLPPETPERDPLKASFRTRMLYSCLVDADFLDTERFMDGERGRGGYDDLPTLLKRLEEYIAPWQEPKTALNKLRCKILNSCLDTGRKPKGIYTLTVPTGGGKTVASLAFALRHAVAHGMKRVIYVVPYTSIIEQNAEVFREILGDGNVLEHHSGVQFELSDGASPEEVRRALAAENWDMPVIVTTAVQFFESIYANRSSKCRKLHNLADSVIIFDEAQMLPLCHLRPCVAAMASLAEQFRSTLVLCTATQPSLGDLLHTYAPSCPVTELCPQTAEEYDSFRRVTFRQEGILEDDALAKRLSEHRQVLCIVNSRKAAQSIFARLPQEASFHLSTLMVPAQRQTLLDEIRRRLKAGEPCRVVSTSLIEAGVDVDFPAVYRELAGLDSVLQAAGRCNREGKRAPEESIVTVFERAELPPMLFRTAIGATREALMNSCDIGARETMQNYFDALRSLSGETLDKSGVILNEYITMFDTPYQKYLKSTCSDVSRVHKGYFSIDKKTGRSVDSQLKRGSEFSDDISAYDLILKNKERLLSFDEPTRFIFSHSALREGWDNPNVFQICTLKHSDSNTAKRQEVGRGLRLCVNQDGNRMDAQSCGDSVHEINTLTVVASESYKTFVTDLQSDIKTVLYDRPTVATSEYFKGKYVKVDDVPTLIDDEKANAIEFYLIQNGYVDMKRKVTDKYRQDVKNGTVAELPDELKPMTDGIHTLIQAVYDDSVLKDMFSDGHETKVKDNPLNENFAKKEFQALWREINHKYAYTVDFDSAELIRNAIAHIDKKLFVSELQYTTTIGRQKAEMNEYEIERGDSFTGEKTRTQTLKHAEASQIKYDLIGKIAEGTVLTRRTVSAILQGIRVDKLYMFRNNPEEFISKVIRLINEQKATMIVEHISYDTIEGEYDSSIFTAEKATQSFDKAFLAKKAIQDYVFTDGSADKSIERKFAEDLDAAEEVCVYAKLPRTFQIPTPVGNYSPDWAIAFYEGTVKHIFFIAETKGTMESLELRPIEQAKISCAKKLFNEMSTSNVVYHDVDSYRSLLSIMSSI